VWPLRYISRMRQKLGFAYIITNKRHSTLYAGATDNLSARIIEHRDKLNRTSFSARYGLDKLVYYEIFEDVQEAFLREKQIKSWSRQKKVRLIDQRNPSWRDLYDEIAGY
jgi:putative endonuclease